MLVPWQPRAGDQCCSSLPCLQRGAAGQGRAGQSRWWPGAAGSPHAQLPRLGLLAPQLTTSSQRPAADMQDPHLPQGTAAMGTAVLAAPNSPSALGTSILILLEQLLYPKTLGAACAKPETQTVPGDRDKWGVGNWRDQKLCPSCDKPACFLPPGDSPARQGSAGFLIAVQRHSMPKTGNGRAGVC